MDKNKKKPQDDEESDILVCARAGSGTDVLPGSVWDKCRDCQSSVWISLSGQKAMKLNKKLVPCCLDCFAKKHKNTEDMEVQVAPGSLQELKRYLAQRKKH